MIHLIYCVFDNKAAAYLQPFYARSKGEAMRSFCDAVGNKQHQFARHPGDYSLVHVGAFDDVDGSVTGVSRVVVLTGPEAVSMLDPQDP